MHRPGVNKEVQAADKDAEVIDSFRLDCCQETDCTRQRRSIRRDVRNSRKPIEH